MLMCLSGGGEGGGEGGGRIGFRPDRPCWLLKQSNQLSVQLLPEREQGAQEKRGCTIFVLYLHTSAQLKQHLGIAQGWPQPALR